MKVVLVSLVVAMLVSTGVVAFAEARQVYAEHQQGYFQGHASLDPKNQDNIRVTWFIPELAFRYRNGPYEDDDRVGVSVLAPLDAPAGDYLVRVTIANDEGKKVLYRYVTIEE